MSHFEFVYGKPPAPADLIPGKCTISSFIEFYYFPTLQFEPFGGMPFLTHAPPPAMFFQVAKPLSPIQ